MCLTSVLHLSISVGAGSAQRMDAEALKASGMLNMLMSAEGRDKLQALAGKVCLTPASCGVFGAY